MPIYEYLCQTCGKKFEVLQRFSDEPLHTHEGCGGTVEKLISTSALQFKGSGWYVNDYAKGATGKPGETKVDGKTESKSDGGTADKGGESKSEAKSETKTESKPAVAESKPAPSSSTSSDSR